MLFIRISIKSLWTAARGMCTYKKWFFVSFISHSHFFVACISFNGILYFFIQCFVYSFDFSRIIGKNWSECEIWVGWAALICNSVVLHFCTVSPKFALFWIICINLNRNQIMFIDINACLLKLACVYLCL